jgi:peptidoglycan/LPS O-acetylase OafA/YrhL
VTELTSSSEDRRLNNFDLIRLFAALQVAAVHMITDFKLSGADAAVIDFGLRLFPGVPVFFVISGFLISQALERSKSINQYYRNRCLRIFPALWVCLVVSTGLVFTCAAKSIGPVSTSGWLLWWAAQMTAFQAYCPAFLRPFGTGALNLSLWTIPIELEFYLLLPAIYTLLGLNRRRGNVPLAILLAASLALRCTYAPNGMFDRTGTSGYVLTTVAPHLWMFLVGVLVQRNWSNLRQWLESRFLRWLLGYLLLRAIVARLHVGLGGLEINPLLLLPLTGVVMAGATSARSFSNRILRHNDISYGIYIYHMPTVNVMVQLGAAASALSVVIALTISLCAATVSWKADRETVLSAQKSLHRRLTWSILDFSIYLIQRLFS